MEIVEEATNQSAIQPTKQSTNQINLSILQLRMAELLDVVASRINDSLQNISCIIPSE